MRTRRASVLTVALVLLSGSIHAADAQGLKFFKNYFETGSHFAAGVALKNTGVDGFATGTITIPADVNGVNGVPFKDANGNGVLDAGEDSADIIAAFLYWETVTSTTGNGATGSRFNNADIGVIAKLLNPNGTPPCWSNGGATGSGSDAHLLKTYRADVLPLLPVAANGKRTGIGTHTVRLQDSGSGNNVPATAGATLLLIYRSPNANAPLKSTVIYDGGVTLNQSAPSMVLPVEGWYQASSGSPTAVITQIVGNGQSNFTETATVRDANQNLLFSVVNPMVGPYWDTYTANVTLPALAEKAIVSVERGSSTSSYDCLSWGVVILTTPVQDADKDGIVDRLESQTTSGTVKDPTGQLLPDLYAMGARPDIKDIFIEVAAMKSTSGYTNPLQTVPANHSHLPSREALDMMARAFRFAPERINVHYDVGNNYQDGALPGGSWSNCPTAGATTWTPNCAIIRTGNSDGGELIEETACLPGATNSCLFNSYPAPLPCATQVTCQFPDFPGTVGWKSGYRFYRDEPLNYRKTKTVTVGGQTYTVDAGPDERACFLAETDVNADGTPNLTTNCRRRFSHVRKDLFHWVLFAHAVGIPKSSDPQSPLYHQPKNMSGIADFNGSDLLVTLGLWDYGVGTPFIQASTLMHELGHNLGRRHGGDPTEPNCKPNYQSVMNYLFQVRGLIDATGAANIGYSKQQLPAINENNLVDASGIGAVTMDYRTRWYAPWSDSFVDNGLNVTPATKRCNGSSVIGEIMARVDGSAVAGQPIDWNANGIIATLPGPAQDLNFSGSTEPLAAGSNDWANINLQQVGSRRNVGGWSVDAGYWDAGYWDAGYWDAGYWDAGYWDAGYWDAGYWDAGYWDAGYWDAGVEHDSNVPIGELDLTTAAAVGNAPNNVKAAVSGKDVLITWTPPFVRSDQVAFYEVYRVEGSAVTSANFALRVPIGGPIYSPATSVIDTTAKNSVTYTYFVLAQFNDTQRSGIAASLPFLKK